VDRHPGRNSPVKIAKLTTHAVPPRWLFLKVETDVGGAGAGRPSTLYCASETSAGCPSLTQISVLILPARKKLAGTGPARTTSASRLIRCAAQGSTRLASSDLVRRLVDADHAVHKRHGTASRVPRICKCRCSIKRQATGDAAVQHQVKEDGRTVHVGPQPVGPQLVGTRPAAASCPRQTRWPLTSEISI
jgi:hypothetical protein